MVQKQIAILLTNIEKKGGADQEDSQVPEWSIVLVAKVMKVIDKVEPHSDKCSKDDGEKQN